MTRELPLLATATVARALRNGTQTQDRRPIRKQPAWREAEQLCATTPEGWQTLGDSGLWSCRSDTGKDVRRAPWQKGDLLYVRETWYCDHWAAGDHVASCVGCVRCSHTDDDRLADWRDLLYYRADGEPDFEGEGCTWRPSIHMPKWAARTWLRVVDVRPENGEITEEDAIAEGIQPFDLPLSGAYGTRVFAQHWPNPICGDSAREAFRALWDSIYGAGSWASRPWRWRTALELDRERSGLNAKAVANG